MDFNYFIQVSHIFNLLGNTSGKVDFQNFSAVGYNTVVKPSQEATFQYSFLPAEAFAGRPFGLNINLIYHDISGNGFQEAIFNETVQIIELDEGIIYFQSYRHCSVADLDVQVLMGKHSFFTFSLPPLWFYCW